MRRVARVWNWLPAFRAVAETEHLPTAAAGLHVTPPALSRTLKVLQEEVGLQLLDRDGRGLKLNARGERLLLAVRTAMRSVHDALQELEGGEAGPVTLCSTGMFTPTFLDATLAGLLDAYPDVLPRVWTLRAGEDLASDLLRGELDVVFTSTPFYREGLVTRSLGRVPNAVFCGPGHPLFGRTEVTQDEIVAHPFVGPPTDVSGVSPEGWPVDVRRTVAVETDRQAVGLQLCASGRFLAVLPEPLARRHELWRLQLELQSSTPLVAIYREPLGDPGVVGCLVEAAAAAVASMG